MLDFSNNIGQAPAPDWISTPNVPELRTSNLQGGWMCWVYWPTEPSLNPNPSGFQYFLSTAGYSRPNGFNMYIRETDRQFAYNWGNSSSSGTVSVPAFANGKPWLFVVTTEPPGGTATGYVAQFGYTSVIGPFGSSIVSPGHGDSGFPYEFGRRGDADATRSFTGQMGSVTKVNRLVEADEVLAIANGANELRVLGPAVDFHWPMSHPDDQADWILGNALTKNGSPFPANNAFSPQRPSTGRLLQIPAAAPSTDPTSVYFMVA